MLVVTSRVSIPMDEFRFEFSRSGGPGGQNVNKVSSKATLRWTPSTSPSLPPAVRDRLLRAIGSKLTNEGEWLVTSQKTRDQGRNVEDCLERVREVVLAACTPPKVRRATRPTLGSQERRVEQKKGRSEVKKMRRKPELD